MLKKKIKVIFVNKNMMQEGKTRAARGEVGLPLGLENYFRR